MSERHDLQPDHQGALELHLPHHHRRRARRQLRQARQGARRTIGVETAVCVPQRCNLLVRCQGQFLDSEPDDRRSEEHTSELQSLMRISYAVFCLKKKIKTTNKTNIYYT